MLSAQFKDPEGYICRSDCFSQCQYAPSTFILFSHQLKEWLVHNGSQDPHICLCRLIFLSNRVQLLLLKKNKTTIIPIIAINWRRFDEKAIKTKVMDL